MDSTVETSNIRAEENPFPGVGVVEERADVSGVARARLGHGIRLLLHDAHGDAVAASTADLPGDGAADDAAAHDEVVMVTLCHDHFSLLSADLDADFIRD